MQPVEAIRPYDPEKVKSLIGKRVAIPQRSNPNKRWWVRIEEIIYATPKVVVVRIAGGRCFGNPRQVTLDELQFERHCDDTFLQSIAWGRAKAKET